MKKAKNSLDKKCCHCKSRNIDLSNFVWDESLDQYIDIYKCLDCKKESRISLDYLEESRGDPSFNKSDFFHEVTENKEEDVMSKKITDLQKEEIVQRVKDGEKQKNLAKEYGVSAWTINQYVKGHKSVKKRDMSKPPQGGSGLIIGPVPKLVKPVFKNPPKHISLFFGSINLEDGYDLSIAFEGENCYLSICPEGK